MAKKPSIRVTGSSLEDLLDQVNKQCGVLYGPGYEVTSLYKVAPNKVPGGAPWFAKGYPASVKADVPLPADSVLDQADPQETVPVSYPQAVLSSKPDGTVEKAVGDFLEDQDLTGISFA